MSKPAFDPGKPFEVASTQSPASGSKPAFNPNQAFEVADVASQTRDSGRPVEATLEGFGNAATFGYLPQINAAVERAVDYVAGDNVDEDLRKKGFTVPEESYVKSRDEFIQRGKDLGESNPGAKLAGEILGSISTGVAGGAALKAAGYASKAASATKVATAVSKAKDAGKVGAAIGLVRNPGDSEGELDPLQVADRLKNAPVDAVIGMTTSLGLDGLGKVANAIKNSPTALKGWSQIKALKASGAMLKDFRKLHGRNKANEVGQALLDNKIISPGDTIEDIAKKAEVLRETTGKKISAIYNGADDVVGKMDLKNLPQDIAKKFDDTALDMHEFADKFYADASTQLKGKAGSKQVLTRLKQELDTIAENGVVDLKKFKEVRQSVDELINFAKPDLSDLKPAEKILVKLRNEMNDKVQQRLKFIDDVHGTNFAKDLIKENKGYSAIADVAAYAKDKVARTESNASFGMRERLSELGGTGLGAGVGASVAGPVGAAIGGFVGGKLGAITTKVAREYGTPYVAISANKIARALESRGAKKLLGKFADPLLEASENPERFVTAVDNLIKNNPEFKAKVRSIDMRDLRPSAENEERKTNRSISGGKEWIKLK